MSLRSEVIFLKNLQFWGSKLMDKRYFKIERVARGLSLKLSLVGFVWSPCVYSTLSYLFGLGTFGLS